MQTAASMAMPYGTCRGTSSARVTGFTNKIFATRPPSPIRSSLGFRRGEKLRKRNELHSGSEQDTAPRTVVRLDARRRRLLGHLQEHHPIPVVGGVRKEVGAHIRVVDMHESFGKPALAKQLFELGVVLRLAIGGVWVIAEIHSEDSDLTFAEHRMRDHPAGRADIAAGIDARFAIESADLAREALRPVVIIEQRIPPIDSHPRFTAPLH